MSVFSGVLGYLVKMKVSLVTILLHLIIIIIGIISANTLYKIPLYKTKRPVYIMHGKLLIPKITPDYCQSGLCPPGVQHLACKKVYWSNECSTSHTGVNTNLFWRVVLAQHNSWRKYLTGGSLRNLPRARFLPQLRWNDELAQMAMRITAYCNDEATTECVNTPQFLHVSRNTYIHKLESKDILKEMQPVWRAVFNEWREFMWNADGKFIKSYPENATLAQSRVANILLQENTQVGCAVLLRLHLYFYVACVYNKSPQPGQRIYEIYLERSNA